MSAPPGRSSCAARARTLRNTVGLVAGIAVLLVEEALRALGSKGGGTWWLSWPILGAALALLAFGLWRDLRHELRVTSRGLERRTAFGRAVRLPWAEVAEVRYAHSFVVHGRDVRISVPVWSDGLGDFAAAVLANVPAAAIDAVGGENMRERFVDMASRLSVTRGPLVRR